MLPERAAPPTRADRRSFAALQRLGRRPRPPRAVAALSRSSRAGAEQLPLPPSTSASRCPPRSVVEPGSGARRRAGSTARRGRIAGLRAVRQRARALSRRIRRTRRCTRPSSSSALSILAASLHGHADRQPGAHRSRDTVYAVAGADRRRRHRCSTSTTSASGPAASAGRTCSTPPRLARPPR